MATSLYCPIFMTHGSPGLDSFDYRILSLSAAVVLRLGHKIILHVHDYGIVVD